MANDLADALPIREYTPDDWDAICAIYDIAKPDELRGSGDLRAIRSLCDDETMQALFRDSRVLVCEVDGCVIGFAGNKGNYISWLFVHPDFRRRGVAARLLREVLRPLRGTVALNVAKNNRPARALYEKNGFVLEKEFVGQWNGYECHVARLRYEANG
jgi:ribosomal protein S18 acetylase RimI-like enzyme